MTAGTIFSRDELLEGLPARRASTLLYAIENRTARLVLLARQALTHPLNERTAQARERQFLQALAGGRELPEPPTVQEIERFAPHWADLVPDDPGLRAELAHQLGQKYRLAAGRVPRIAAALELETASVREAYATRHGAPLEVILVSRISFGERVTWFRAAVARRLEELPPFWMAWALTLTGTVGASTLALPIAVADVGAAGAVVVLLALGLVHVWTIAAMVESVTRSGSIRYGTSYLGRLVGEYLGPSGSALFTVLSLTAVAFALLVRVLGLSTALAGATGVVALVWVAFLLVVCIWFLGRGSLASTLPTTLVLGAANVAIVAALALVALPAFDGSRAFATPDPAGAPALGGIGLAVGVVLSVYARHISVGSAAKVVLRRDPSGRALLWGTVAATVSAMALYMFWTVAVIGAVPRQRLAQESGTALAPLAATVGPAADLLGGTFAVLSMGIGSIYMSLVLFQHTREWLPASRTTGRARPRSRRGPLGLRALSAGSVSLFAAASAPVVGIFALVGWLIASDNASFSDAIAFVSALTGPTLSGVFPVLLLAAARKRGEYVPGSVLRALDQPVSRALVFGLFVAVILAFGLIVWSDPIQRFAALVTAAAVAAVTLVSIRRHAYAPRAILELRRDAYAGTPRRARLVVAGRLVDVAASAGAGGDVATVTLPPLTTPTLLVWVHDVTVEGRPEGHAAEVEIDPADGRSQRVALGRTGGRSCASHLPRVAFG